MLKSARKLGALAVVLTCAAPALAQEDPLAQVVASVNGTEITIGHMMLVHMGLPQEYQEVPADALWDGILQQIIQHEVFAQSDAAVESARVTLSLENQRRTLLASEAISALAKSLVTPRQVEEEYKKRYVDGARDKEFDASHILLSNEEDALAVMAEVSQRDADFAAVARQKSEGPSGPNGGSLGWFGPGDMVPSFQEAVDELDPGDVTGPVRTQFGWHVIKLNDVRVADVPAFEVVAPQLEQEMQQAAVSAYLDALMGESDVVLTPNEDLDRSLLGQRSLLLDE